MSYQNINQYNFRRWYLKPLNEITDISLASDEKNYDEEVIFSPYLIANNDGERMPLKFDFSSSGTVSTTYFGDFDYDTIVSENYWNPKNIDLFTCGVKTELCNVGLTGIDNGLVKKFSGETIELNTGLYSGTTDKFSRYKYDRRFKMHPVTGFTTPETRIYNDNSYNYKVELKNDNNTVGDYISFSGGFYQGFYKVFGYDYEVLPERYNLGWTTEFLLRYRWTGDTDTGLNVRYPENKGMFYFYGARAENKFYHYAAGSPSSDTGYTRVTQYLNCLKTCECLISGYTGASCQYVYQQSGGTTTNCSCGQCPCNCTVSYEYPELDPLYDGVSNALALRLSGDTGSPRLCVKTYRITGGCETTGTCLTGITYTTGTSVTEWCSTRGIFDDCTGTTYSNEERWVQIDAVFERNTYLDDCDLEYKGGLDLLIVPEYLDTLENNSVALIEPPITQELVYDPAKVELVIMNERWLKEKDYRLGTLKFYVNGKLFLVVGGFEEIIPRPLNGWKETEIGVAYNISLGGGTQGLHDNLTVTGCAPSLSAMTYQQDPECLTTEILDLTSYSGLTTNIKLEEYFGGSFNGDISAFRMYAEPLNAGQIIHNFKILKNRYGLLDPFCLNCEDDPGPLPNTPTPSTTPTHTPTPSVTPAPSCDIDYEFITPTPTNTPSVTQTNIPICSKILFSYTGPANPLFEFTDCSGSTYQINGVTGWSGIYCGDYFSSVLLSGDGFYEYYDICEDQTPINPKIVPLGYSFDDINASCIETPTTYYQEYTESLSIGDHIYSDYSLDPSFYVVDGYYSDGTNVYIVTGGTGYINFIEPCIPPSATPTETPTQTPTQTQTVTPSQTYYYYFLLDCDATNNKIGKSIVPGLSGVYNVAPNTCYQIVGTDLGPSFDYDLDSSVLVVDCSDSLCLPATPTSTPTLTVTPTNSETPTNTPTLTPSVTITETETPTPTQTPTNTSTPSPTPPLGIVTDNLQFYVTAGDTDSYPGTGTTWTDLSPNSYTSTLVNGVGYSSASGGTLTFSGSQYVDTNQSLTAETFSVSAWFRTTAAGVKMIISKETTAGWPWNYRIWLNGGIIIGDVAQSGAANVSVNSANLYSDGNWYNVMFTRDDTTLRLYVNGVEVANVSDTLTGSIANSQEVWIGRSAYTAGGASPSGSYQFVGDISEVMVYNSVLSSAQVSQNFNATKTRFGL